MRLNRGTILLAVALIAIIVIAALLSSQTASTTATATPAPTQETVRLFPELDGARATRLEVRNNISGVNTVLTRDPSFLWSVAATGASVGTENRDVDQVAVPGFMVTYAQLASTQNFQADDIASYGLDQPTQTITMTTDDGGLYTLHVGNANLGGSRYFVIVETTAGSGAPAPTAAPTVDAAAATPEVTPETTAESEAAATATPAASDADATAEPSATPTPLVSLTGTQTIYLAPKTEIDEIIALIAAPPYLPLPSPTPTDFPTANPFSEVDQTATAAVQQTATSTILTLTAQPTATTEAAVSTAEVTPAAVMTEEATPIPPSATPAATVTPGS
jgi:hypothetical protein